MVTGIAIIAVLGGALVRGYSGFGASMVWVSSLSLLYPPLQVVPVVMALEVIASLVLLPRVASHVEWKSMSWMLGATLLTLPIGVLLLSAIPANALRILVGVAILLGTTAMAAGVDLSRGSGRGSAVVAGAVSGIVNGSTGIGGPPAILLYFSPTKSIKVGRATLIAYFLGTDLVTAALMAIARLFDRAVFEHLLILSGPAILGIAVGQAAFARYGDRGFRKVVICLLLVLSLATIGRAIAG